ncbi:MAG: Unknown protein [uncultured Sulfurovum sp.]|uniref:SMODS-associated and fused to various effectors domain-containing protein n=1 Tax=uncultured Sulfurovum sp. TaxID=269237 RepID=A0A6S6TVV2_9BACT|nr:MAG: Unknown protein [uncultured Sulfurovum sp.]
MIKNIFSNSYAQTSLAVAAVGGLISDEIGQGYWVALLMAGVLFVYALYDEKRNVEIYSQKNLPIPIVFNVSNPADTKSALGILFDKLEEAYPNHQANLKKHFNIIENDLIFKYDGDIFNEKRFVDFLKISKHNIKKLEAQTPKNVHFHIVYIGPIANAILVGTLFGTEGVTLYQYNKSSNSYNTILSINSRAYKEGVDAFKVIEKKEIGELGSEVTVAIDMASHKVALSGLGSSVVHLESRLGATIEKSEDFIRANQEIYTVINALQQHVPKIRLVYSMPVTLGFLLGMSIQNYWDIEITQYTEGEYKSVIKHLNEIKYYF